MAMLMVVFGHLFQRVERFYGDAFLTPFDKRIFNIISTPFSGCIIFFCISGYSLFVSIENNDKAVERHVARYISKKIFRIWPPYAFIIVMTFLFIKVTGYTPAGTNLFSVTPTSLDISLVASLTLSHDLVFGTFPRLFPPGWFVETQVQFFIICTLIWIAYLKIDNRYRRLFLGLLFLVFFSAVARLNAEYGPRQLQYALIAFMPYFWIGALLADLRLNFDGTRIDNIFLYGGPLGWLGLGVFIVLGALLENSLQLVTQIFCLAVIFRASNADGTNFHRVMIDRWLTRIGVASYSIYLLHLQILQLVVPIVINHLRIYGLHAVVVACGVIGLAVVLAGSFVFFWLIERPFVALALTFRARLRESKALPSRNLTSSETLR